MNRQQAINYLLSSGFSEEQIDTIEQAFKQDPTTKNDLGVDCISRQAVLNATVNKNSIWNKITDSKGENLEAIISKLPSVTPQEPRWISLTKRPMTDEEREYYKKWSDVEEEAMIFVCPLPEDGQEVLVSYGGYVCVDTFCKDDGCYFEGVDIDDVDAWMPLPPCYEPQKSEDKE